MKQTLPTLEKLFSNWTITRIFQPWKCCFQTWTTTRIFQPWKYCFQTWTIMKITNLGDAVCKVGKLLGLPTLVI